MSDCYECGNAIIDVLETCDDGGKGGCTSLCQDVSEGWICSNVTLSSGDLKSECQPKPPEPEYEAPGSAQTAMVGSSVATTVATGAVVSGSLMSMSVGPGVWGSFDYIQLSKGVLLLNRENRVLNQFFDESFTFFNFNTDFGQDISNWILGFTDQAQVEPPQGFEGYGFNTFSFMNMGL